MMTTAPELLTRSNTRETTKLVNFYEWLELIFNMVGVNL